MHKMNFKINFEGKYMLNICFNFNCTKSVLIQHLVTIGSNGLLSAKHVPIHTHSLPKYYLHKKTEKENFKNEPYEQSLDDNILFFKKCLQFYAMCLRL